MTNQADIDAQIAQDRRYNLLMLASKRSICAECEGALVVIWNAQDNEHQLKCGQNKAHIGFKTYRESKRETERRARQMAVDNKQTQLAQYSGVLNLEKAAAEEILITLWPKAPKNEVFKAALICRQYGLNPLMRHIYLVAYEGKEGTTWSIQIGIGATRMIARRSGPYSYEDDTPRLMSEAEQIKILGGVEKDKFWAITRVRDKEGMTAQGYGNWPKDKLVKGADKGNTPQNMAFIRSERAALDKLFPEKLPAGVEVVAQEYEEAPKIVDTHTGEILAISQADRDFEKLPSANPVQPIIPITPPLAETPQQKQERTDILSRALAEAGYPSGTKREALYEIPGFKDKYPGFTQLGALPPDQYARLLAWCQAVIEHKRKEAK